MVSVSMPIPPHICGKFNNYVLRLGLKWEVKGNFSTVAGPQLVVDRGRTLHQVSYPFGMAMSIEDVDLITPLVRAKFAEKYDPIFGTVFMDPKWSDQQLAIYAPLINMAQRCVEIWESDFLWKFEASLVKSDVTSVLKMLLRLSKDQMRSNYYLVLPGLAQTFAIVRRLGLTGHDRSLASLEKNVRSWGIETGSFLDRLVRHYQYLPVLPSGVNEAIKLFEQQVQAGAVASNFPIVPIIKRDGNGNRYWSVR